VGKDCGGVEVTQLKPCPCGKPHTEADLYLACEDQAKYGYVCCKCQDWCTEFRNQYAIGREKMLIPAVKAWNLVQRREE
jgi:hypothetical protein